MNGFPPGKDIPQQVAPAYRDRQLGLILFGILEILLGACCLLMAGFLVFGQMMLARTTEVPGNMQMLVPGILFYVGLAVVLAWLGVGSMLCRRWARALLLILAWVWLGTGVLTVPMMAWLLPKILASAPTGGPAMPAGAMTVIVVVQIVFLSVFFILLPGALVLFYRSPHAKHTCEARDPARRWTDACPLPILAVACLSWWGALLMCGLPLAKLAMFPFFGMLVTGLPGALLMIGAACVLFWIGWSWYQVKVAGWWASLAFMIVMAISNLLTFTRVGMAEVYERLGYPQAQIDLIQQQGWMTSGFMMGCSLIWWFPMLGYLVWVKRYFRGDSWGSIPNN